MKPTTPQTCPQCDGRGVLGSWRECKACNGTGRIYPLRPPMWVILKPRKK